MREGELLTGLSDRAPAVVALVPLHRAHLFEEAIHRLFVVEQLAVEVAGIPVKQDTADVEDHRLDGRPGT
jgi:hypothetical protein